MIDNTQPLKLEYDEKTKKLSFEGKQLQPATRTVEEMCEVMHDQVFCATAKRETETYHMYRAVIRDQDQELFSKNALRYDVTIIFPEKLGSECNKTAGHYHEIASSGKSFPELYQVLQGQAHYLLQKRAGGKTDELEDIVMVKAKAGESVLVPPDYGHVTINPSKTDDLIMANLVEKNFKSDYAPIKEMHGAAYFELSDNAMKPNEYYRKKPELYQLDAEEFQHTKNEGITNQSIYQQFLDKPDKFKFLREP
ncbi:MAG: glucose-6-phosphate isomerase family protein [Candidatus Micrarchaeia archaeon]